ncbi:TolC family protein [Hephaestia mangrovi]|uniref:TolC family protein n=1 Tax=Hephaestia mangrovi TaxID=2873268 RepID=UPI001CA63C0D|nr:TolC family protein [Hephaestia mangrovi]MBY8829640.1 TolC family protein [Hephaestia mangrovi]
MYRIIATTALAVVLAAPSVTATAQTIAPVGPRSASRPGPLPRQLTLNQALVEAEARSPTLAAARAEVSAAEGRVRQAGFRTNPEFTVELENFAGSGVLSGFQATELTASISQRIDLAGHRRARVSASEARLFAAQLQLAIARANLIRQVRNRFAEGVAARDLLAVARDNVGRAQELARVAKELVDAGREPPLRGLRAQAALTRTTAVLQSAEANERNARSAIAALLGSKVPPEQLVGDAPVAVPAALDAEATLDVALAKARAAIARADVEQARAEGRVDPSVGVGVRHLRESGDVGLVASVSMPLPIFDRNQGNIAAARSDVAAADARVTAATNAAAATIADARASLAAAEARLGALEQSGLAEAREALRLAELSYRAGKASLVELLDAQQAYALLQSDLIAARQARAEAAATLAREAAAQ